MAKANPTTASSELKLNVIVVGAGIGGTAAATALGRRGHDVTVLEDAPQIGEVSNPFLSRLMRKVGAGIQVAPNLSRIVNEWGLAPILDRNAVRLSAIVVKRWKDGKVLAVAPAMPKIEQVHGAPQYVVHRHELLNTFLEGALALPTVKLITNSHVESVDFDEPSVTVRRGKKYIADVVIAADGLKSVCRAQMFDKLGLVDKARPTGDAAYRIVIPAPSLLADATLKHLITDDPVGVRYIGPGRHIMAYPIRGRQLYNMVLAHPDLHFDSEESWTAKGSKNQMLKDFEGWDEELQKLLDYCPPGEVMRWKLCDHDDLPTWIQGKLALMGDACHPMLPYVAQGAAQAVEDAAVLGVALSKIKSKDEIPAALKAYEIARKERAEKVQGTAGYTRTVLHLPDGEAQVKRDTAFANVAVGGENPDLWGDSVAQKFLWSFDAEADFEQNYDSYMEEARNGQKDTKRLRKFDFDLAAKSAKI